MAFARSGPLNGECTVSKSPRLPGLLASLAVLPPLLAMPVPLSGQGPGCKEDEPRIVGFVIDAGTELPLANALVSVEASNWASLTTGNGRFLLCNIESGPHVVTVERLGYETLTADVGALVSNEAIRLPMEPDPVVLEGLEIVTDRFERRRRTAAVPVRAYDQEVLARSSHWSAAEFIDRQTGVFLVHCPVRNRYLYYEDGRTIGIDIPDIGGINRCVRDRGETVRPRIYLDEAPLFGGWAQLASLPTSQLYMIEIYSGGRNIRAYTRAFVEHAARTRRLTAVPLWN